jgi:hypothetical protein
MHIDTAQVRHVAATLGGHGADLATEHARLAAEDEGRPWGGDRLGAPFGAAYHGARDAVLALVGALAGGVGAAGRDLAELAAGTERADTASAAAFRRGD